MEKGLLEVGTRGGVQRQEDGLTVTVPTLLWVKAFDLLLEKFKKKGVHFEDVVCLSGTGQQHGSVYWKSGAQQTLKSLNQKRCLSEQLQGNGNE